MGFAYTYTYRTKTTEPTEQRIEEKKEEGAYYAYINSPEASLPQWPVLG